MPVVFIEAHELSTVDLLRLVQGDEVNVLRREGLVGERTTNGVEIVCSDSDVVSAQWRIKSGICRHSRDQSTLPRQVLVQLVLQADEGVVGGLGELDIAQDGGGGIRADEASLGSNCEGLQLILWNVGEPPVWRGILSAEDVEVHRDAWEKEDSAPRT